MRILRLTKIIVLIFSALCLLKSSGLVSQELKDPSVREVKPITIGMILPLSGPLAFFGQAYVQAYELAIAARPELAKLLKVRCEDSAYNPQRAISAFNLLTTVAKVDVVFSFGGPMLNALAPLAEARKVPFYAAESEKADCEGRAFCVLFRNEQREWGEATWYALRKRGYKRIGIVKNQNQFMNTFVSAIIDAKRPDESVTILVDAGPDTVDMRTEVLRLRDVSVDALGVYLLPATHRGFISAFRGLPKRPPLFGVEELFEQENNRGYEDVVAGALVFAPWASAEYRNYFESKYGHSGGFLYTPAVYDFFNLVGDVIKTSPAVRGLDFIARMRFSGTRTGASGEYFVKISEKGVTSYSFPIAVYRAASSIVVDDVYHAPR
jgi:ABC-type branched-subunit amino acid transport system substrate-binding protein